MSRALKVFLGSEPRLVGVLRHEARGTRESASFEYDSAWLKDGYPLEPALPLVGGPQFRARRGEGSVFFGAIADTEPDGWGKRVILRDHAKRRRRGAAAKAGPLTSADFLLAVDDFSRVGALRFQDEQGVFQRAPEDGRRTAPPLVELGRLLKATRAVEQNTETEEDLRFLRGRGTSLGGLRPKCSVVDEEQRLWIGKFASVHDERSVPGGEVLAMQLAKAAGIEVAEARLVESERTKVALIRRFDRDRSGRRLMYASAATLLGAEPEEPGEHTYTEIVDLIRLLGAEAQGDIEELWRRIAFSVSINNVDDHLRNHGFLHAQGGKWRLAPAFDLNPFPDRARELKTWISEESGPEASLDALWSVAAYFRISRKRGEEILRQVNGAVRRWRAVGKKIGMSEAELDAFEDAFVLPR